MEKKPMNNPDKIRHYVSVFQMMFMAGRDEAALKQLQNLLDLADQMEAGE